MIIYIGTLGKLTEMVKSNIVDFSHIRFFILDEADRLTDPDNLRMIMSLYNACPVGGSGDNRLQVSIFLSLSVCCLAACLYACILSVFMKCYNTNNNNMTRKQYFMYLIYNSVRYVFFLQPFIPQLYEICPKKSVLILLGWI